MANRIPRLGGQLPTYVVGNPTQQGRPDKPKTTKQPIQRTINGVMQAGYGSKNYVQRSPRVNIGTPGTKNYVQRSAKENIGTPGTKNYVPRNPGATVKEGEVLTRRPAKQTPSKRPVGPTR